MLKSVIDGRALTVGQEVAADRIQAFLAGRGNVFVLRGYAGTGKTFLLQSVAAWLASQSRAFRLMAPTGRAAKVLRDRTGFAAGTIHKAIYAMDRIREYAVRGQDGSETFKFYFDLSENRDSADTVYIVDEASMVSDLQNEGEFLRFGSGRLLSDLVAYIRADSNDHARKLVLVGDPAQLPPVGSTRSPALDPDYLLQRFDLVVQTDELTEPVRHAPGSGILSNATRIRDALRASDFRVIDLDARFADIRPIGEDGLVDRFLECDAQGGGRAIVVAHSNRVVRDYNRAIRARLHPGAAGPVPGERLIVVANNYAQACELLNGEFVEVVEAGVIVEERVVRLRTSAGPTEIPLRFRDVRVRVPSLPGPSDGVVACKVFDPLLESAERDLTSDESRALYVDFRMRHRGLKPGTIEFRQAIRGDPWFNVLRVKYGYAVTCHKAQGGEWDDVLVDFTAPGSRSCEAFFRWAYTAITRARGTLHIVHEPHCRIDTPLRAPAPLPAGERSDLVRVEGASGAMDERVLEAVSERLAGSGIQMAAARPDPYCAVAVLSRGAERMRVRVHYNRRNRITYLEWDPAAPSGLASAARDLLVTLVGVEVHATAAADEAGGPPPVAPRTGKPHMDDLLVAIGERLAAGGVAILAADSPTAYHMRVRFGRNGERALVNYYFDRRGRYSRCVPDVKVSTSLDLLARVVEGAAGQDAPEEAR